MTVLHAGGKFGGGGYKVSGGLHGVGASVVNALSVTCEVEVRRDGKRYFQAYDHGVPRGDIRVTGKTDSHSTGTTTTFLADPGTFGDATYNFETLAQRLREQAYLTKGLSIRIADEREDREL